MGAIGIYEYAANDIYEISKEPQFNGKVDVVVSFYEIYCGKLYDLLQNRYPQYYIFIKIFIYMHVLGSYWNRWITGRMKL